MLNIDFIKYGFTNKESFTDWMFSTDNIYTFSVGAGMFSFIDIVFGMPPLALLILVVMLVVELITNSISCHRNKSCSISTVLLRWGLKVIIYFTAIGLFKIFSSVWGDVWYHIYSFLHQGVIWYFIFATLKSIFEDYENITGEEVGFLKILKNIHKRITKNKK